MRYICIKNFYSGYTDGRKHVLFKKHEVYVAKLIEGDIIKKRYEVISDNNKYYLDIEDFFKYFINLATYRIKQINKILD